MSTATKLSAYGLALAVIAGGAWAVGTAVGPLDNQTAAADHSMSEQAHADEELPGLAVSANGYRLELEQNQLPTGNSEQFRFRVRGPRGDAVTRFDVEHDKRLHLVLVRRDGSGYQHLHPELAADGTWTIPLTLPAAGSYRVFTDFTPSGGMKTVLGTDIQAPGEFQPLPDSPIRTAIVDGYEVRLDGELIPGKASQVSATVTRNGAPVTDLQPYLGVSGHLVALRAADLGYLHVHPVGEPGDGGAAIRFAVEVPTPGRYRLFLDFKHAGTVRTAEFTVDTGQEAHS
jgi:hypothetical protein